MSRASIFPLLLAVLTAAPLAAEAVSVTGSTGSTIAGSVSGSSAGGASASGNGVGANAPTHFQLTGTITNVNGDTGTFQVNGATMSLVSGAAIIGTNGQVLRSLSDVKPGQTVQVTLAEVKSGDPTRGPRTAYSVRVIQ